VEVNRREILRQQQIAEAQFLVKRACKSSADQKPELLILEKSPYPLAANFLSDSGVKDFNVAIIEIASDYPDAISISPRFIPEQPQKFRAFRRQSKRNGNHRITCCDIVAIKPTKLICTSLVESGKEECRKSQENLESRKPGRIGGIVLLSWLRGFQIHLLSRSLRL
jgi:hypothetical protein